MHRRCPVTPFLLALLLAALVAGPASADEPTAPSGWMGVMLNGSTRVDDGTDAGRVGVLLGRIFDDSPAAKAGLRARDIVLAVDGTPVDSSRELGELVRGAGVGAWIPMTVWRRGEEIDLRIRLTGRPKDVSSARLRNGFAGLSAIELPPSLREHFGAPDDAGVMISEVEPGSPAEAAGFELGDVVFDIDGESIGSPSRLAKQIRGAGVGNILEATLVRDGVEIVLETVIEQSEPTDR